MKNIFVFLVGFLVNFIMLAGGPMQAERLYPGSPPQLPQEPDYTNPFLLRPAITAGPVYQIPIVAALGFQQSDIDRLIADATPGEIVVLGEPSSMQCSQMQQLQDAGILVGGYVDTGNGIRDPGVVLADIDRWFTACKPYTPDWIFGDQGLLDRDPGRYARYVQYRDRAHERGAFFMLNEGGALAGAGEGVMALADTILVYEDTCRNLGVPDPRTRTEHPPAWLGNYPPEVKAMTIHTCPPNQDDPMHSDAMLQAVAISQYVGAVYVYVYDGTSMAYDHLPPYWSDEVAAITSGTVTYPRPPVSTLTDPFDGTEIDPTLWWVSTTGGMAREDGSLILSLNPGPGGRVVVRSQDLWSLAGSWAFVEVPEVVGPGASNMFVIIFSDETGREYLLQWWYESGNLFANYWVNGQRINVATLPYSPTDHRWWGFFEENGVVSFVTSPDGQTWTERGSVPGPFPLTSLYVQFNANGFGTGPHGQARYNNFNVRP